MTNDWCGTRIVRPPEPLNVSVFVDASTSWGISFVLDGRWLAWELKPGWKTDGRDIGWTEMVAVDLAVWTLATAGFRNCHIII